MNDLRFDEVHTAFLDQGFVSLGVLREGLSREVCINSVIAQVTDTQDWLRHLHHMAVILSQVACETSTYLTFSVFLELN